MANSIISLLIITFFYLSYLSNSSALSSYSLPRFGCRSKTFPNQLSSHCSLSLRMALGSDVLIRPDDEDSEEFKQYLRQLLRMQANRASSGFAAPSSGSADAYQAKLNRLKIEQNRRRELGLPSVPLDTSYKPEDFQQAMIEGREPLVSDTVLKGNDAIPRMASSSSTSVSGGAKKLRNLSIDEIRIAEAAEERIQKELREFIDKGGAPGAAAGAASPAINNAMPALRIGQPPSRNPDELDRRIDEIMRPKMPSTPAPVTPLPTSVSAAASPPAPVTPRPTSVSAAASSPAPVTPLPISFSTPPESTVFASTAVSVQPSNKHIASAIAGPSSLSVSTPSPAVTTPISEKRKLSRDEMEQVASAIQKLVKHRGGGPFGKGRLVGEEAVSLIASVSDAIALLERDCDYTSSTTSTSTTPILAVPKVVTPPATDAMEINIISSVDIQGDISTLPTKVLEGMRDDLISRLSEVQQLLISRQRYTTRAEEESHPILHNTPGPTPIIAPHSNPAALDHTTVTEEKQDPLSLASPTPIAAAVPEVGVAVSDFKKDVKLALALLLKHRGGPGFGHGRLQGEELLLMQKQLRLVSSLLLAEAQGHHSPTRTPQ